MGNSPDTCRQFLALLLCLLLNMTSSHLSSDASPPALVLDVDNTLYKEEHARIERQIVQNTHSYCHKHFGMSKEKADDLFRKYGSTVEGLKHTLWKDLPSDKRQRELTAFYREVWHPQQIDVSNAIPTSKGSSSSTGYSHGGDGVLHRLFRSITPDSSVYLASNSPSWHVDRVLQALGLSSI